MNHRYCVIMCGGIGARLWPYSRTATPKQFIDFFGTGRSLLQMTFDRILPIIPKENIFLVTNAAYRDTVASQIPEINPGNILLEPVRRNTAPAVAWAAYHIAAIDPDASMLVTPADQLITRENDFINAINAGFDFVEANPALLTLGVTPTRPETGYGYIQVGRHIAGDISKVKTFTEKPGRDLAEVFVKSGEFFWNSGIFLWSASSIIDALHDHTPEIAAVFDKGLGIYNTPDEAAFINDNFPACPSVPVDTTIIEKSTKTYVETVNIGWSDLGTWSALYDNSPRNRDANVTQNCQVIANAASGNIISVTNSDKLILVDSLNDFIVADSADVLLICPKTREQSIRQMVNDTRQLFGEKYL